MWVIEEIPRICYQSRLENSPLIRCRVWGRNTLVFSRTSLINFESRSNEPRKKTCNYPFYARDNKSIISKGKVGDLTHYCLTGPFCSRIVKISFLKKKGSSKNFLWVGRRQEPILGYISKFDEKKKKDFRQ